jgi:bifunctional DNA-binding transcriptional regulator/antitoxin component of YhaV-PrlF toxin-antitoxin module
MELEGVTGTATLSEKGWLVIPQEFRRRHCLKKGDRLRVIDCGSFIAVVPPLGDPIGRGLGLLPDKMSMTDQLLEARKAELGWEERDIPPPRRD